MSNKKLAIIALLSIIVLIIVVFYFSQVRPEEEPKLPSGAREVTTQRNRNYQGTIQPEVDFGEDIELPTSLPVYSYSEGSSDINQYRDLINKVGFVISDAQTYDDPELGKIYIFSSNDIFLYIIPDQNHIDYKTGLRETGSVGEINDNQLIETAKNFLVENFIVGTENELGEGTVQKTTVSDEFIIPENNPNLIRVTFQKNAPNGYPIIPTVYGTEVYEVYLNSRGGVVMVYVDDTPELTENQEYTLKTYQEIINSLDEADVRDIANGTLDQYYLSLESLSNINLTSVSTAYLQGFSLGSNILEPVYILEGTALVDEFGRQDVELLLPAISDQP